MNECESWTMKKAENRTADAFKICCWRRLLRVPWTARRLKQSILKEINPEYSLEGLMLKLKFQYLMWRADSLESPWWRRRGWQNEMVEWYHWLNGHEFEQTLGDAEGQGSLVCCHPWGFKESDMTERLKAATLGVIWKGGSTRCLSAMDFHFWSNMSWIIRLSSA